MRKICSYKLKPGIIFIFLFTSHAFRAQETLSKYTFIKMEYNRLYFSKDSSAFTKFFEKLERVKTEKYDRVNIVHIGGSHVQGGTWSNTFLSAFQSNYKTAGGGYFVFPYKVAKTNSPPYTTSFTNGTWKRCRAVTGKDFCLPLGMSALSITTNDTMNYFGVKLTSKAECKYVNNVKLYHNFNNSFEFFMNRKDTFKIERQDFKEKGYTLFSFNMPVDSVNIEVIRLDTLQRDFVVYGLSLENDMTSGFYLAALGANGASSASFLKCADLFQQLQTLEANLVIISLGVNDTQSKYFEKEEYIENYDSLITLIKKSNPSAAIILTTTSDNYIKRKTSNKRSITAREAMFELMEKHNVAVWDLFYLMGGYRSIPKWYKAGLASKDKVHFTGRGYAILGNLMYEALMKSNTYLKK